jgi:Family of unknown function (DUF6196)
MVDISHETYEETISRLMHVIRACDLKVYEGSYVFNEFPLDRLSTDLSPNAIAIVRDDELWSQLVPYNGELCQAFKIFRFHFPSKMDNSGFVGWLATHLKQRFGTGVFVVCGQNRKRGGIFDYWGCPVELAEEVIAEVKSLVTG